MTKLAVMARSASDVAISGGLGILVQIYNPLKNIKIPPPLAGSVRLHYMDRH